MSNICPKCGSGKVNVSASLIDTPSVKESKCDNCDWQGDTDELISVPLDTVAEKILTLEEESIFTNSDPATVIAFEISSHFLQLIAQYAARDIGLAIILAGLVTKNDTENLTRLIRIACLSVHKSVLTELEFIQNEVIGDSHVPQRN